MKKLHEKLAMLLCSKLLETKIDILTAYNMFLMENTNSTLLVGKYYNNVNVKSLISALQHGDEEAKFPLIDRLIEMGIMSFEDIVVWGYDDTDCDDAGCDDCNNLTCTCLIPVQNINLDMLKEAILNENLERCQFCNYWVDAGNLIDDENNVVGCGCKELAEELC